MTLPAALHLPWKPPTDVDTPWLVPVPEPAAPVSGQPIEHLRQQLTEQAQRTRPVLERLADVDPRAHMARHPIIGDMDLAQWLRFCAYPLAIHERQVRIVKPSAGFPAPGRLD